MALFPRKTFTTGDDVSLPAATLDLATPFVVATDPAHVQVLAADSVAAAFGHLEEVRYCPRCRRDRPCSLDAQIVGGHRWSAVTGQARQCMVVLGWFCQEARHGVEGFRCGDPLGMLYLTAIDGQGWRVRIEAVSNDSRALPLVAMVGRALHATYWTARGADSAPQPGQALPDRATGRLLSLRTFTTGGEITLEDLAWNSNLVRRELEQIRAALAHRGIATPPGGFANAQLTDALRSSAGGSLAGHFSDAVLERSFADAVLALQRRSERVTRTAVASQMSYNRSALYKRMKVDHVHFDLKVADILKQATIGNTLQHIEGASWRTIGAWSLTCPARSGASRSRYRQTLIGCWPNSPPQSADLPVNRRPG